MRDFTYIDATSGEIILVCIDVVSVVEADYLYKEVMGVWPWVHKYVDIKNTPTCVEAVYIAED